MQLSGVWWLLVLLVMITMLYFLAKYRQNHQQDVKNTKKALVAKKNASLTKLHQQLKKQDTAFNYYLRKNHILVSQVNNGKQQKVAMITLDKNKASEVRQLGTVNILNFDKRPSAERVMQILEELLEK